MKHDEASEVSEQLDAILVPHLKHLFEQDIERVLGTRKQMDDYQANTVVSRTQFFDRLAIGAAGTLAAIVTFLGGTNHHLQPHWLLRTTLVILGLVTAIAMLRNFLAPSYRFHAKAVEWMKASCSFSTQREALAKSAILRRSFENGLIPDCLLRWPPSNQSPVNLIDKQRKKADQRYRCWKAAEFSCYGIVVIALGCLVALVWLNF